MNANQRFIQALDEAAAHIAALDLEQFHGDRVNWNSMRDQLAWSKAQMRVSHLLRAVKLDLERSK